MSSNAIPGIGTQFSRWTDGAWVALAEVTSINGPGMTRNFIDVTNLDSTGGYAEFIAGLRDGGNIALSMNFTAATYAAMKDDFEDDDRQNYQILLVDGSVLEIEGLVTELPLTVETADKVSADVTIKVSGKVEFYEGSSGSIP